MVRRLDMLRLEVVRDRAEAVMMEARPDVDAADLCGMLQGTIIDHR